MRRPARSWLSESPSQVIERGHRSYSQSTAIVLLELLETALVAEEGSFGVIPHQRPAAVEGRLSTMPEWLLYAIVFVPIIALMIIADRRGWRPGARRERGVSAQKYESHRASAESRRTAAVGMGAGGVAAGGAAAGGCAGGAAGGC